MNFYIVRATVAGNDVFEDINNNAWPIFKLTNLLL